MPPFASQSATSTHVASQPTLAKKAAVQDFWQQLEACRETSAIDGRIFYRVPPLLDWFRSAESDNDLTNAERVLTAVLGSNDSLHPNRHLGSLLDYMGSKAKCWLKVFIILLQLGKGVHIKSFVLWGPFNDNKLPISKQEKQGVEDQFMKLGYNDAEASDLATRFSDLSYELCTDTLDDAYKMTYGFEDRPLPITYKEKIREGGVGAVYQVEVPADCVPKSLKIKVRETYTKKGIEYYEFALKVLLTAKDYEDEHFAYSALDGTQGFLRCLGFWEYKISAEETEYHLLLEFGAYSLSEYFTLYVPPADPDGIFQFWRDLQHIVFALSKIHNLEISVSKNRKDKYWGWHLDIKPMNILYCEQGEDDGWKIADPGFAKFVPYKANSSGLPTVRFNGDGTSTYGPPEYVVGIETDVTQTYDIWSLGCVLLEAATWLILGHRAVEQFRWARKALSTDHRGSLTLDSDIRGADHFHNDRDISHAVLQWIAYLRASMRSTDPVTSSILEIVQNHMLLGEPTVRITALDLQKRMKSVLDSSEKRKAAWYTIPDYFYRAFGKEQERTVKKIQEQALLEEKTSTGLQSRRFKSSRFIEATKEPHASPAANEFAKKMRAQVAGSGSVESGGVPLSPPRRRATVNEAALSRESHPTSSSVKPLRSLEHESAASLTPDMGFDYWGAMALLEKEGWAPGGALEYRGHPQSPSSETSFKSVIQPPQDEQSRSRHPPIPRVETASTRPRSSANNGRKVSALRQLFTKTKARLGYPHKALGTESYGSRPTSVTPHPSIAQRMSDELISPVNLASAEIQLQALEEHRCTLFDAHFKDRDVVFLIDDGQSMYEHWTLVRDLAALLVALLYHQDDDGMDLYFTSSRVSHGPLNEPREFFKEISARRPEPPDERSDSKRAAVRSHFLTPAEPLYEEPKDDTASVVESFRGSKTDIRDILSQILEKWREDPEKYKRKLTIIVLTDGVWETVPEKRDVGDRLAMDLKRYNERSFLRKKLLDRDLSIQFILFGHDPKAEIELTYMDDNLTVPDGKRLPDIIDVEKANGNVMKMILGSILKIWDGVGSVHEDTTTQTSEGAGDGSELGDDGESNTAPPTPVGGRPPRESVGDVTAAAGGQFGLSARSATIR